MLLRKRSKMKTFHLKLIQIILLVVIFSAVVSILLTFGRYRRNILEKLPSIKRQQRKEIVITIVTCEDRLEETLTMMKSALYFNELSIVIRFQIIADEILRTSITKHLKDWQAILADTFSFETHSLQFPRRDESIWRTLFKPCAAQRLFLPNLLRNIDATIYVDTDIVFLSPASDIWNHFSHFNESQIAGLSPEHEDINIGWYNRFARHPFFGDMGVNSGVMLMNLTKMREFKWEDKILPIYKKYKSKITWGDQDLINILFAQHPDKLYIFPCIFNYRPDHCIYMNGCNVTGKVRLLHGNRRYFHLNKQPVFKLVYETFKDSEIKANVTGFTSLNFNHVHSNAAVLNSTCGKVISEFGLKFT